MVFTLGISTGKPFVTLQDMAKKVARDVAREKAKEAREEARDKAKEAREEARDEAKEAREDKKKLKKSKRRTIKNNVDNLLRYFNVASDD